MGPGSMGELLNELDEVMAELREAVGRRDWATAEAFGRRVLSAAGKLHQRARVLGEVAEESAYAAAEVDRALMRARRSQHARPGAVEGDQELPFPKAPRKRGGKKGKE